MSKRINSYRRSLNIADQLSDIHGNTDFDYDVFQLWFESHLNVFQEGLQLWKQFYAFREQPEDGSYKQYMENIEVIRRFGESYGKFLQRLRNVSKDRSMDSMCRVSGDMCDTLRAEFGTVLRNMDADAAQTQ